jgi:hypothetical protein
MVNIQFDEETAILKLTYSITVDFEDIQRFMDHVAIDHRLPEDLKVFHHAAYVGSTLKMKDLLYFSKEMKKGTGRFNSVRGAAYTTNSLSLTLSKLYERLNMDRNTKWKTFNSERAAIAWLLEL